MSYSTLEIQRDGAVATLWMNRPEVFNAFDEQLIAELTQACQALDHDDSVRVVVLAGRGRHFSAGADLNWMRRAASHGEAENLADARQFARMLRTLATLSKPTVARVHGAALGGGVARDLGRAHGDVGLRFRRCQLAASVRQLRQAIVNGREAVADLRLFRPHGR